MNTLSTVASRHSGFDVLNASSVADVRNASDRDHIGSLASRIWDKVADFFCGTVREEAKKCLFDLYAPTTPDAQKIELFFKLRGLAGEGFQERFEHRVEDGRETYALLLDGQEHGAGVLLTRTAIGCDWDKIEAALRSDRSHEDLEKQLRLDIVRAGYEVAGQPVPDDDTLALEPRQDLRLQLLDAELAKLACTPEEVEAVHALAHQATFALIMQSTLVAAASGNAPMCPSSARQQTDYRIQRENAQLQLVALCRQDVATEPNEELRLDKMESVREMEHLYQSLEIRVALAIDARGQARISSLDYLAGKPAEGA